jgi:hypothetical protein
MRQGRKPGFLWRLSQVHLTPGTCLAQPFAGFPPQLAAPDNMRPDEIDKRWITMAC